VFFEKGEKSNMEEEYAESEKKEAFLIET